MIAPWFGMSVASRADLPCTEQPLPGCRSSRRSRLRLPLGASAPAILLLLVTSLAPAGRVAAQRAAIYPDPAAAPGDLERALAAARASHKRVIVDFGGNWCGDCRVLNLYLHDPVNLPILERNFELVDVNVGRFDANRDLAARYGIPLEKGVPALAVLSPSGRVLMAQRNGEFEKMRSLASSDVTAFLNTWKPDAGR
jgi:thiol-disulfide isomerase/thioredoxin